MAYYRTLDDFIDSMEDNLDEYNLTMFPDCKLTRQEYQQYLDSYNLYRIRLAIEHGMDSATGDD